MSFFSRFFFATITVFPLALYFEKNNFVNVDHNKQVINQYLKEENVTGTFIENITSSFQKI